MHSFEVQKLNSILNNSFRFFIEKGEWTPWIFLVPSYWFEEGRKQTYEKEEKEETIDCGEQQKAVCSRLLFNTIMMDTFVFDTTI
jgi:hypothetical protein